MQQQESQKCERRTTPTGLDGVKKWIEEKKAQGTAGAWR